MDNSEAISSMLDEVDIPEDLIDKFQEERGDIATSIKLMCEYDAGKNGGVFDIKRVIQKKIEQWKAEAPRRFAYKRYENFIKALFSNGYLDREKSSGYLEPSVFQGGQFGKSGTTPLKRFLHLEKEGIEIGCTVIDKTGGEHKVTLITPGLYVHLDYCSERDHICEYVKKKD